MPFEVGQLAGDYEILGVLGKGGMGRVYRVRNVISNRVEAMKVLLADVAAEAELSDRFIGEIRTLGSLDHPNIAKLHGAFKIENQLVMLMEFIEGDTLFDRAKTAPIPLNEVLSYATQTLAALSYAHEKGVIHRDIKPSNIMVTPQGVAKLTDFGIAKSSADPVQTRTGITMGSLLYMSPEQVRGSQLDARSDLYSVGVLLYELTAGCRPFEGDTTYAILEAQLNAVPKAPLEVNANVPKPLSDIIMTALSKEPADRFQSAKAFRNALESVRQQNAGTQPQTIPVSHSTPPPLAAPILATQSNAKANRSLWMALGAIACVCALIAAAIALPHFWRSSAASTTTARVEQSSTSAPTLPVQSPDAASTTPAPPPVVAPDSAAAPQSPTIDTAVQSNSDVPVKTGRKPPKQNSPQPTVAADQPPPTVAPAAPLPPPGPSPEEIEKVRDRLIQLHARADAVRSSIGQLRQEQAASGLGLRHDIVASSSRLDSYLQEADRAAQTTNLESARKNMDHVEEELTKLENFLGK